MPKHDNGNEDDEEMSSPLPIVYLDEPLNDIEIWVENDGEYDEDEGEEADDADEADDNAKSAVKGLRRIKPTWRRPLLPRADLLRFFQELLGSRWKSAATMGMLDDVFDAQERRWKDVGAWVVPTVRAERVKLLDADADADEDAEDAPSAVSQLLQAQEAAKAVPLALRQAFLKQRLYPYVVNQEDQEDPTGTAKTTPAPHWDLAWEGQSRPSGVALPTDSARLPYVGARVKVPRWRPCDVRLADAVALPWPVLGDAEEVMATPEDMLAPTAGQALTDALEDAFSEVPSFEALAWVLLQHGWDWNALSEDATQRLVATLTESLEAEPEIEVDSNAWRAKGPKHRKIEKATHGQGNALERAIDALKQFQERFAPVWDSVVGERVQQWAGFLQNTPPITLSSGAFREDASFASQLAAFLAGQGSLTEFVDYVRVVRQRYVQQQGALNLQGLSKPSADRATAALDAQATAATRIYPLPMNESGVPVFASLQHELAFMAAHADAHMPEEAHGGGPDGLVAEDVVGAEGTTWEGSDADDDDMVDIGTMALPTRIADAVRGLPMGVQEVLNVVYERTARLADAAGLEAPWDALHADLPHALQRLSRAESLKESAPMTSLEMCQRMVVGTADVVEAGLKTVLDGVQAAYEVALARTWERAIAGWVLVVQERVASRTFTMDAWKAHPMCVERWSPYGFPMTGSVDRTDREGVLAYLWAVWETVEGHAASDEEGETSIARVRAVFDGTWSGRVQALRAQARALLAAAPEVGAAHKANGERVKKNLNEAMDRRDKVKMLEEYTAFLHHLPTVLLESSLAKHLHRGCCLQRIAHGRFEADGDWRNLKRAHQLKQLYAKQKTGSGRTALWLVLRPAGVDPEQDERTRTVPTALQKAISGTRVPVVAPTWSLDAWWEGCPDAVARGLFGGVADVARKRAIDATWMRVLKTSGTREATVATLRTFLDEDATPDDAIAILGRLAMMHEVAGRTAAVDTCIAMKRWVADDANVHAIRAHPREQRRALYGVVLRALCLPGEPENHRGNVLQKPLGVSETKVIDMKTIVKAALKTCMVLAKGRQEGHALDGDAYLNQEREQRKNNVLDVLNGFDDEMRELYTQYKDLKLFKFQREGVPAADRPVPTDDARRPEDVAEEAEWADYGFAQGQNRDDDPDALP